MGIPAGKRALLGLQSCFASHFTSTSLLIFVYASMLLRWMGVSCSDVEGCVGGAAQCGLTKLKPGDRHVIALQLSERGLSGPLPASLGALSFVVSLALAGTDSVKFMYHMIGKKLTHTLFSLFLYPKTTASTALSQRVLVNLNIWR